MRRWDPIRLLRLQQGLLWEGEEIEGRRNVEIRNGTITGFMAVGIYEANNHEQPNPGMGHRVIDVRIAGNGSGCILNGFGHLVKDCTVFGNRGSYGIAVGKGSTVADNVCYNNGGRESAFTIVALLRETPAMIITVMAFMLTGAAAQ